MSETTTLPPSPPDSSPGTGPGPRIGLIAALCAIGAVVFLGIAAVYAVRGNDDTATGADDNDGWHGTEVSPGLPRPDFTLTDTSGRPFDFAAQTKGRLTLLFFGYTHCPDVCPAHMSVLRGALEVPGTPKPLVVFVTTDPARDTGPALRKWLDQYDKDFIGLTGTPEQIAAAERAAKVAGSVRLPEDQSSGNSEYDVGHAAQIVAYTPDDLAHVVYPFGTRAADWAADLPRLLDEEWPQESAS